MNATASGAAAHRSGLQAGAGSLRCNIRLRHVGFHPYSADGQRTCDPQFQHYCPNAGRWDQGPIHRQAADFHSPWMREPQSDPRSAIRLRGLRPAACLGSGPCPAGRRNRPAAALEGFSRPICAGPVALVRGTGRDFEASLAGMTGEPWPCCASDLGLEVPVYATVRTCISTAAPVNRGHGPTG